MTGGSAGERHGAGSRTAAQALSGALAAAGVDAVYGAPYGGLAVTEVRSLDLARVLAAAHARVHGAAAAVHKGDGRFVVGPPPPDGVPSTGVDSVEALWGVLGGGRAGTAVAFHLDREPDAPLPGTAPAWPAAGPRWEEPPADVVAALAAATAPLLLVGPGVLQARQIPGLHALATAGSLGVLNTWGAKGVFDWRSRHHLATVGLQRDDLRLGGLAVADLVVTCGLDPAETPVGVGRPDAAVDLAPAALGPLAERWHRPPVPIAVPPLRAALAGVTEAGWARSAAPLAPSQVTRTYGAVSSGRGLVAADPGAAGYWVARTFPTTAPGEAVVPGRGAPPGFAVAAALVARLRQPGRPTLAAADHPLSDAGSALLDEARRLGVPLVVEVWDPGGPVMAEAAHRSRLQAALQSPAGAVLPLATDRAQLDRMVEVAGPVNAWDAAVPA